MDQYVSWGLSKEDMSLDTIWERFEDFCKLQSNEVHAWFDLLTSFCQGNKSLNKWYNAVQLQVNLAKYPPETAKILNQDTFWFFLWDEDFVLRTIMEGNINLDKFPASRVCQLVKKFKSSMATMQHIKQVAGDPQATHINLMQHQRTELPTNRHNKKRRPTSRPKQYKATENTAANQVKKYYDNKKPHRVTDHCNKCGDSIHAQGFQCPAKKNQCKVCKKYGHFSSLCYEKKTQAHHKNSHRNPKPHQLHVGPMYAQDSASHCYSEVSSSDESFCLQWQAQSNQAEEKQIPQPVHLITNLAYHLKLHHTRNMYLQAWLDMCTDLNIMPASVYQLLFKDPEMKQIKPCKMQISTYTADTVKIIGSCIFNVVHVDMKKLVPVTFHIANNDGSVLLSCKTSLALQLIKPQSKLDYLPPWASLITSTMDHPKKTKMTALKVHWSEQEVSDQMQQPPSKALMSRNTVQKQDSVIMITSKEQILSKCPDIFEGISRFPGLPYHIQVDMNITLKQALCRLVVIHLKEAFKKEINKMLQASVIRPVTEATLWINSFILVEGKDKSGNLKLCIGLDPMNLNEAVICEPYHFKTLEDIAHLIANSCIMMVCHCKKGYWHQELDEASSFLTTFNTEFGRFLV